MTSSKTALYSFEKVRSIPDHPERPSSPPPVARSGHRLVTFGNHVFSIGGFNPVGRQPAKYIFREMLVLNAITGRWSRPATHGLVSNNLASHCAVVVDKHIFVFGGSAFPFGSSLSTNLYQISLSSMKWTLVRCGGTVPPAAYGQAADYADGYLYIVGGTVGLRFFMGVHRLHLASKVPVWEELDAKVQFNQIPPARYRHEVAYYKCSLYVFGGGTSFTVFNMDPVPVFDLNKRTWTLMSTKPDPKYGFPVGRRAFGYCRHRDRVFVCGGLSIDGILLRDIWSFDLATKTWSCFSDQLPYMCAFHGCTATANGRLIIFGGIVDSSGTLRTAEAYRRWVALPSLRTLCADSIASDWSAIASSVTPEFWLLFLRQFSSFFADLPDACAE